MEFLNFGKKYLVFLQERQVLPQRTLKNNIKDFYSQPEKGKDMVLKAFQKYEQLGQQNWKKKQEEQRKEAIPEKKTQNTTSTEEQKTIKTAASSKTDDTGGLTPNDGNGSDTEKYKWTQTNSEVDVYITIPKGIPSSQMKIIIKADQLSVNIKSEPPLAIQGTLHAKVKPADSEWVLDSSVGLIHINLIKMNSAAEYWTRLLVGEKELDTKKIKPKLASLSDFDGEEKAMLNKMRYESVQKNAGKPVTLDSNTQDVLNKLQSANPNMTFTTL